MKKWLYTLSVALAVALTTPGVAAAADLGGSGPREYVEAPASYKDWTGIYAGFLIGYSTADFEHSTSTSIGQSGDFPFNLDSSDDQFNFGVQLGADVQYGIVVVGAVADFSWMGLEGNGTDTLFGTPQNGFLIDNEFGLDTLGTARLRIGALATPNILVYATGGIAFGQLDGAVRGLVNCDECEFDEFEIAEVSYDDARWGYTVGAGVEAKLTENIRAKVEYLYVDLGEAEYNINVLGGDFLNHSGSVELDLHLVRAGLAYQF